MQLEVEPQAAQAQPAQITVPVEPGKVEKKSRAMRKVSASRIKSKKSHKKKRKKAAVIPTITITSGEQNQNLEEPCGLGCIVIPYFQHFNNINCFLTIFCILLFAQGIVFSLVKLSIDTFMKYNCLKATENVVLPLGYDISSCMVVLFISYYGGRGNIIRWIVVSSFLVGFGSLLFAFPHYSGNFQLNIETEDICKETKTVKAYTKLTSFRSKYVSFFILGQIVQGIAGMPLYILGVIFIDDSVSMHSTGIYLGITEAVVSIGYALGFVMGAPLIKNYENTTSDQSVGDSDHSKHWLHSWWIRFVFISVIAWSTLIPLSCFPRSIRGTARLKAEKHKKPHLLDRKFKDQESETSIEDFFASVQNLMTFPIFVCLALTRASDSVLLIVCAEILPKYLESQFVLTPSVATTVSGIVLIPGAALAQLLGGIIVSKLYMDCKGFMRFIMATSAVSLILLLCVTFVYCKPLPFAGINEDYGGTGSLRNLTAPCNSRCRCTSSFYSTVCGRDDIEYFSPCFAGCTYSKTLNGYKTYFNCSCINEGLTTPDDQGDFIDAKPGTCDTKCYKLPLFIVFIFSTTVFAGFSGMPNMLTILRIVSEKQRSLALGVTYVILRVFGTIPGPLVFKMLREASCIMRDKGRCGYKGSCWIYNRRKMTYLFIGLCLFCKAFTIFFTAIAFVLYKSLKKNHDIRSISVKNPREKEINKEEKTDL